MNSKKIIIFDYDILFNILDEIKENLNFDIINCNQKNLNTIIDKLEKDFLIISRKKEKNLKNNLIIENNPLSINKLIEMININFLKIQFNFQSEISIGTYKLDLNSREISKNKSTLDLTERETNLIVFLKNSSKPVKINELQKKFGDMALNWKHILLRLTFIDLRKKIKDKFDDENFIISLPNGYKIN